MLSLLPCWFFSVEWLEAREETRSKEYRDNFFPFSFFCLWIYFLVYQTVSADFSILLLLIDFENSTFKYSIHFLLYLEWKEVIKNGKNKKFYGLRLEAEVRHEIKPTPDTGESGLGQVWRLESDQLNTSRDEKMKVNLTSNLVLSIMLFKTEFNGISST